MRIAIDGGALSTDPITHFGNFTVTNELLKSLFVVDKKNIYDIYTLDEVKINAPDNFNFIRLRPTRGWMSLRVSFEQALKKTDVFLALNQALPIYTQAKIISLSHGLSFLKYPQLYPDSAAKMAKQVQNMYTKSNDIIVSSQKVKDDFALYVGDNKKINILPFGIPSYFKEKSLRYKRKKIILYVGMGHAIKQVDRVVDSFEKLTHEKEFSTYLLLLVGVNPESITSLPANIGNKVMAIPHAEQSQLLKFYNEASCVVSASLYESFNLPLLEALSQGTAVAAVPSAVIPEMKEYVEVSENLETAIKKAVKKSDAVGLKKLHNEFSWEHFTKQLIQLYEA